MKIHFSITPTDDGFTYQLYQWSFLHDLGLALGYRYFHVGFDATRSNLPDMKIDIYGFLGITRHFQAANPADEFEQRIRVHIPVYFTWQRKLSDIAVLMAYLKEEVTRQAEPGKKILLQLVVPDTGQSSLSKQSERIPGKRSVRVLYYTIKLAATKCLNTNPAPWRYGPDLYAIYFEQRKTQPQPSRFPPGKIKVAVHIRRGDFAVINAPWGEKIECLTQGFRNRHIAIPDFQQFVRQLASLFDQHEFSTLFFSDGYERTPQYLRENKKKHHLSDEQVEILSRQMIAENKREFGPLEDVKNSRAIIGETPDKLFDLIHACLTADIIITAAYYKFTRKLGSLYFNKQRSPIMIFLHQGDSDLKEYPPIPVPTDKSIFFNVRNPDYAALEKQLKQFLPA